MYAQSDPLRSARFQITQGVDSKAGECLRIVGNGKGITVPISKAGLDANMRNFDSDVKTLLAFILATLRPGVAEQARLSNKDPSVEVLFHGTLLRRNLLGKESLGAHCPFHQSVLLEVDEYCARFPWELLWDSFVRCHDPAHRWSARREPESWSGKGSCGEGHDLEWILGPLGMLYELGVRIGPEPEPARQVSRQALIFGNPKYRELRKINQQEHLDSLEKILGQTYQVIPKTGAEATKGELLRALEDASVGVVYIFAHGDLKSRCIFAANDDAISLHDLPTKFAGAPFFFLNCCWAAKDEWSDTWGATTSFASELLNRGACGVLAPLCPVINVEAAQAAIDFFENAKRTTVGRAAALMRTASFPSAHNARVRRGGAKQEEARPKSETQPPLGISWFAYRLSGDPQLHLPTPSKTPQGFLLPGDVPDRLRLFLHDARAGQGDNKARPSREEIVAFLVHTLPFMAAPPDTLVQAINASFDQLLETKIGIDTAALCGVAVRAFCDWLAQVSEIGHGKVDSKEQSWQNAHGSATKLVTELDKLNNRISSDAFILMWQVEICARACLTKSEVKAALLAGFLTHPLSGVLLRQDDRTIGRVSAILIDTHRGGGPRIESERIESFLKRAQKAALTRAGTSPVTVRVLFEVFDDLRWDVDRG